MKILPPNGGKPPIPQKARKSGPSRLLGMFAKSSDPPEAEKSSEVVAKLRENRRMGFKLNDAARNLACARGRDKGLEFPATYHRVAQCRWSVLGPRGFVRFSEEGRGYLTNVVTCGSVWACPMCTAVIQEGRRQEIAKAIDWAYSEGLQPVMVTFTFPHDVEDDLRELLQRQAKAFELLRYGSPWKRFKEAIGYQGLIRSLELTYGENGWHPHTHELFFVSSQADADQLEARLTELWESACVRAGLLDLQDLYRVLAFRDIGVKVIGWCKASDYLAKQDDSRHWGVDRELAKSSTKAGRATGQHPFGLLAAAASGDMAAGERYIEYIEGMKGKRQLFWSRGLKGRVGIEEQSDEELAAYVDPSLQPAAGFDNMNYYRACRLGKRALMLEMAEAGYAEAGLVGAQVSLGRFFAVLYGMERG